ncbi:hypothetical protein L0668_06635 [Paraglaciecola aquimarina]|uniref:Tetratricopeptide repeat protein n=1 Tax=Paraglaciecola algarum TaxID=3050085 RepID=A0ABS9D5S0_9ALTE|nr:hypothetical protein [Paraglaciecola sp. G1-23]MCF2947775.1 hypothetical protein [Paraglaciecola sp. G1-23]
MSKLLAEIRRRRVLQTFIPYLGFVWLILQIVAVVAPMFNFSPLVSTFIAVVLFAGMPVMLYLSWYFDFTFQGLEAIPDKTSGEMTPFGKTHWAVLLIITLSSGGLAYQFFSTLKTEFVKQEEGLQQTIQATSIAVLPFKDSSPDQDQAFLAQGLAEEITSLLGQTQGLTVASSSSSAILNDRGLDPVTIARRLKVDTILTGSVRKIGDKLTVRTELINAKDGKVLWTESFARKFKDIFLVESEIARSAVNLLQDTYLESGTLNNPASTNSTDAYVIYLKGREQYRKQTTESMKAARKLFEQAIGLDPEYAQAYVALADTVTMLAKGTEGFDHDAFFGVLDGKVAAQLAEQNLAKAFIRNPNLAEAYAVRGLILAMLLKQTDDALSSLNKAINLNPSLAKAYMWKFALLDRMGRLSEAWDTLEIAFLLDPISIANQYNRGFYLSEKGMIEESSQQFHSLINEFPKSPLGYSGLASNSYLIGDLSASLPYWKKAIELSPNNINFQLSYIEVLSSLEFIEEAKNVNRDPLNVPTFLLIEKKYSQLFAHINNQLAAYPDDPWLLFESAWYHMLVGDQKKGKQQLVDSLKLFKTNELYNLPHCSPAIEIAWALKEDKRFEESEELVEKCHDLSELVQSESRNNAFNHYLRARILALKGNIELSANILNSSIKYGWRLQWAKSDPLLVEVVESDKGKLAIQTLEKELEKEKQEAQEFILQLQN